jgi:hypothetical protein
VRGARDLDGLGARDLAGAAHLPSLERPEAFDSAVVSFLARHAG